MFSFITYLIIGFVLTALLQRFKAKIPQYLFTVKDYCIKWMTNETNSKSVSTGIFVIVLIISWPLIAFLLLIHPAILLICWCWKKIANIEGT